MQPLRADQHQIQERFIDPFEYRHISLEYDERRPLFESVYIGDQLSEHPDKTVFLSNKQFGGKIMTKEEYLVHELLFCAEVWENIDLLPESAKEYFESSETFTTIFRELETLDDKEILARTEKFITEHGEYCRERLSTLHDRLAEYRQKFVHTVSLAVENGFLPESAKDNLAMLEKVSFSVTDMVLTEGDPDTLMGGYYAPQSQNIGVSIFLEDEKLEETVFHEMVHAISGHTVVSKYSGYIQKVERTGLPTQNEEWGAWLNEALTEHIARSLLHGNFDVITPNERLEAGIDQGIGSYWHERHLMGGLVQELEGHFSLPDLLNIYFQHRTEGSTDYTKALRQLVGSQNPYSFSRLIRLTNHALNRWKAGEDVEGVFGPNPDEDTES